MARRTKRDAQSTRDSIIDAAEDVFYAQGVSRTSLEQVATTAKVTRGAIYWHFEDKIALCDAMMARVFLPHEDMLARLDIHHSLNPLDELKSSCLFSLKMMATDERRRRVVSILTQRCEYLDEMAGIIERRNACKKRMLDVSEKLLIRARKLKMLAPYWTPRKAAVTLQALMHGLIALGLEQPKLFDLSTAAPASLHAFFAALKSP